MNHSLTSVLYINLISIFYFIGVSIIIYRPRTSPRVVRVFPCILRLRSTTCYSELIEESVCLFAMDSTRREAALARRRERERARRANETAEERETRLARRRVRDRRANETLMYKNCVLQLCIKIVFLYV